NEQPESRGHGC
nr:immunoglobulin heavy chain junction region [Homo sapiens]